MAPTGNQSRPTRSADSDATATAWTTAATLVCKPSRAAGPPRCVPVARPPGGPRSTRAGSLDHRRIRRGRHPLWAGVDTGRRPATTHLAQHLAHRPQLVQPLAPTAPPPTPAGPLRTATVKPPAPPRPDPRRGLSQPAAHTAPKRARGQRPATTPPWLSSRGPRTDRLGPVGGHPGGRSCNGGFVGGLHSSPQVPQQGMRKPPALVRGGLKRVGLTGLEPVTSSLSGKRSNRLSYRPARRRQHGQHRPMTLAHRGASAQITGFPGMRR